MFTQLSQILSFNIISTSDYVEVIIAYLKGYFIERNTRMISSITLRYVYRFAKYNVFLLILNDLTICIFQFKNNS